MILARLLLVISTLLLGACTNYYGLRYTANPQPDWASIYADYTLLQDAVAINIDTD